MGKREAGHKAADDDKVKITRYSDYSRSDMSDVIALLAANIEDAYRMSGVDDYTAKDCVDMAARVVLNRFMSGWDTDGMNIDTDTRASSR